VHRGGHHQAERISGLEVNHQLKFRWQQNWQIGGFGAFKYPTNVDASLLIPIRDTRAIAERVSK
jgi:hypothetical protein